MINKVHSIERKRKQNWKIRFVYYANVEFLPIKRVSTFGTICLFRRTTASLRNIVKVKQSIQIDRAIFNTQLHVLEN